MNKEKAIEIIEDLRDYAYENWDDEEYGDRLDEIGEAVDFINAYMESTCSLSGTAEIDGSKYLLMKVERSKERKKAQYYGEFMKLKKAARVLGCRESYYKMENDCEISINLVEYKTEKPWYFVISRYPVAFNSSLDWIMFESKEECLAAAEDKLKEIIESGFSKVYDNVHRPIMYR